VVGLVSATSGAGAGLRAQTHLLALLMNLGCWVAPRQYGLAKADEAFDPDGQLATDAERAGLAAVVEQVLWAAPRIGAAHAAP
jgi:chromate reductase, NAD(P)H dehydrogenase (quinone)